MKAVSPIILFDNILMGHNTSNIIKITIFLDKSKFESPQKTGISYFLNEAEWPPAIGTAGKKGLSAKPHIYVDL